MANTRARRSRFSGFLSASPRTRRLARCVAYCAPLSRTTRTIRSVEAAAVPQPPFLIRDDNVAETTPRSGRVILLFSGAASPAAFKVFAVRVVREKGAGRGGRELLVQVPCLPPDRRRPPRHPGVFSPRVPRAHDHFKPRGEREREREYPDDDVEEQRCHRQHTVTRDLQGTQTLSRLFSFDNGKALRDPSPYAARALHSFPAPPCARLLLAGGERGI